MISSSEFREIVSGRRVGLGATLLRSVFSAAELPYTLAVGLRNRRFDAGKAVAHRVGVPVISVGNLSMGGTGKTPMVRWLAEWFAARNVPVVLISRGYKPTPGGGNDEAMELADRLPGVPHLQNPDRVTAAARATREHECGVILLDDAFQHRRIHRDLDIVLLDALEPFGFDHVFPRGTLREPVSGLKRADIVALSRADVLAPDERDEIRRRVAAIAPHATWLELEHRAVSTLSCDGVSQPVSTLRTGRIAAFCGIGNPAGFRHTLSTIDAAVAGFREFPDHHHYSKADIEELTRWASRLDDVSALVCTHKDLVKIQPMERPNVPLVALIIGLAISAGEQKLRSRLEDILAGVGDTEN